jgi:RNA polymerase sigma factor (sigma-70 family)
MRLKKGHEMSSYQDFFLANYDRLMKLATRPGRDKERGGDIVHDLYLSLMGKDIPLEPNYLSSSVWYASKWTRKNCREYISATGMTWEQIESKPDSLDLEENLINKETIAWLLSEIEKLPTTQHNVLTAVLNGVSVSEYARLTGKKVTTVAQAYKHGCNAVKKALQTA